MFTLRNSIKFLLFMCVYVGYTFVLYFAITFPIEKLNDNKNNFTYCTQMYVYSAIFLGLYAIDTIRFILYIIFSIISHTLASKTGSGMFIANIVLLSYGILLQCVAEKNCLTDYDNKYYLYVSGIGLLFSIITHIYNNYDIYFGTDQKSSLTKSLLNTDNI